MAYYLGSQATRIIPRTAGVQTALASVDTRSTEELNPGLKLFYNTCESLV
jgi:hypothetical protein